MQSAAAHEYGPTPETKRKLRPDPIEILWRNGTLDTKAWHAASEIRGIVERVAGRFVRSPAGWLGLLGTRVQTSPHHLDGVPLRLQSAYLNRYIPWARLVGGQRCGLTTCLDIVFSVLIDGVGVRSLERRWGLRHGSVTEALVDALRRY